MRNSFSLLVFILIFSILVGFIPKAHSSVDPADYHWHFWVGGLRIWVQYPRECHAGDSISYNILIYSSRYSEGNYVEEIKVTITVPISATEFARLYEAWIYQDTLMPNGNEYNRTITVAVPEEAWWYVSFVLDVSTYSGDMEEHTSSNLGLYSTLVTTKTREDLWSEIYDLEYNYTSLENEYKDYKDTHNYSNSEYNNLNSTYNQYVEGHSHSDTEYSNLESKYNSVNGELDISKNLNYIITAIAVVFLVTSIYFARRK